MKLEVFDPPMCCSSGVCEPDVDPALTQFAADLEGLNRRGVEVCRYNLAHEPMAFARNTTVRDELQADEGCLPLVLLNGKIVSKCAYPSGEFLASVIAEETEHVS